MIRDVIEERKIATTRQIAAEKSVHELVVHRTQPSVLVDRLTDTTLILHQERQTVMSVHECDVVVADVARLPLTLHVVFKIRAGLFKPLAASRESFGAVRRLFNGCQRGHVPFTRR